MLFLMFLIWFLISIIFFFYAVSHVSHLIEGSPETPPAPTSEWCVSTLSSSTPLTPQMRNIRSRCQYLVLLHSSSVPSPPPLLWHLLLMFLIWYRGLKRPLNGVSRGLGPQPARSARAFAAFLCLSFDCFVLVFFVFLIWFVLCILYIIFRFSGRHSHLICTLNICSIFWPWAIFSLLHFDLGYIPPALKKFFIIIFMFHYYFDVFIFFLPFFCYLFFLCFSLVFRFSGRHSSCSRFFWFFSLFLIFFKIPFFFFSML